MADTLESLEIEVKHSASDAGSEIGKIAKQLEKLGDTIDRIFPKINHLQKALSGLKNTSVLTKMSKNSGAGKASNKEFQDWVRNADKMELLTDKLYTSRTKMNDALKAGDNEAAIKAKEQFLRTRDSITKELAKQEKEEAKAAEEAAQRNAERVTVYDRLKASLGKLTGVGKLAGSAVSDLASKGFGKLSSKLAKPLKMLGSFAAGLKRILFYRVLRTIIKSITDAMNEGLESAYKFSAGINTESHRFAVAMDSMTSSSTTMKSQIGSAFIALLTAIAPIINSIIAVVTRLADAISQLISAFTGATYLKASKVTQKFADSTKSGAAAAKEWKNQLLGFDEINRLEEPSNGGGGGGSSALDPSDMFEDAEIDGKIKQFVDTLKKLATQGNWRGLGTAIGGMINSILPSAEQWNQWGQKLGYGLNGAISTLYYTLRTIDFGKIGRGIANYINGALSQIDAQTWGATLIRLITSAFNFLFGYIGNLNWSAVGETIGGFISGAFHEAAIWFTEQDWSEIGKTVVEKIKLFLEGLDFSSIARSFFELLGAAFRAIIKLLDEFIGEPIRAIGDFIVDQLHKTPEDVADGFKKGLKDAFSNITGWIKDNVVDPFVNGFKGLLGIASPSTVFAEIGNYVIEGFLNGLKDTWEDVTGWFHRVWNDLSSWWNGLSLSAFHIPAPHFDWTYTEADGVLARALSFVGLPSTIPHLNISWYAQGGFPDSGELFIAQERGPELVGNIGSQTAVANNDQIVEGIRQGVYEAVSAAMSSGERDVNVKVFLDSREIKNGQKRLARASGV